ncbi:MAG: prepilin-type N-terminal cleavage/methylation domain-containing protein [Candidatus Sumerlaeia bacterium]|nr:prepilin-type N-terminal cleavage/methylation domain-containing protein [Candidatus Sumerlaeia bacterium]
MTSRFSPQSLRAVTLTELLVVLTIISLLATIAVPVYVQKTEQARRTTARNEVRNIAQAQELVAATHGYYVPMHLLDNLANDGDNEVEDDFANEVNTSDKFFIDPFRNVVAQDGNQPTLQEALTTASGEVRAQALVAFWTGPFLNPARVARSEEFDDRNDISSDVILDPWGRPYVFFSPEGPLAAVQNISDLNTNTFDLGQPNQRYRVDNGRIQLANGGNDPFDRFAIVSFGSDGILDTTVGNEFVNDVYYTFGSIPNESAFNLF